jgi:hypothetical protein
MMIYVLSCQNFLYFFIVVYFYSIVFAICTSTFRKFCKNVYSGM